MDKCSSVCTIWFADWLIILKILKLFLCMANHKIMHPKPPPWCSSSVLSMTHSDCRGITSEFICNFIINKPYVHYPINMILFKTQILFMNSWLTIKYSKFFCWWDGKIFPLSSLKLRFWDVLGCLQYLLERLAITKYETNGALVEVTIEVVVPSDLSSKTYILCKVLQQNWIWVKWPSNSRLKSISIHPLIFLRNGPLISLTRSYESKAVFDVNHNASLFSLSEDEAHSQKIKTVEEEQPQHLTVPDSVRFLQKEILLVLFVIASNWTMNKKCSKVIKSMLDT